MRPFPSVEEIVEACVAFTEAGRIIVRHGWGDSASCGCALTALAWQRGTLPEGAKTTGVICGADIAQALDVLEEEVQQFAEGFDSHYGTGSSMKHHGVAVRFALSKRDIHTRSVNESGDD